MPKLNLTQGFVRKSEIQKGLASVDYYDERMPGLLLKVLSSGRKTYYIRYKNLKKVSCQRKIRNAVILKLSEARCGCINQQACRKLQARHHKSRCDSAALSV